MEEIAKLSNQAEFKPAKKSFVPLTEAEVIAQGRYISKVESHLPFVLHSKQFEFKLRTDLWRVTRTKVSKHGQISIGWTLNSNEDENNPSWVQFVFNMFLDASGESSQRQ